MKKTYNITWFVLILLTIVAVFFTNIKMEYTAIIVLGLSFLKLIGVTFYFMELKKANVFWKILFITFLGLLLLLIGLV